MATTAMAPAPPHATPSDLAQQILTHATPRYTFNFSPFLKRTYNHALDPTSTSTQSSSSSSAAPATTSGGFNSLVCKHWLRALCKKGEHCEFLHEYNLRKMPECNFFVRNGYCSNGDECLYLHIDPQSKLPPCPWYERGFCPLGPECSKKHVRRKLCVFYLAGFCPEGRDCKEGAHARWEKDDKLPEPVRKSDVVKEEPKREDPMAGGGGGGYGGYGGGGGGEDDSRDFGGDRGGRFDGRGGGRGGFGNRGGRWRGRGDRKFRGGRGHH